MEDSLKSRPVLTIDGISVVRPGQLRLDPDQPRAYHPTLQALQPTVASEESANSPRLLNRSTKIKLSNILIIILLTASEITPFLLTRPLLVAALYIMLIVFFGIRSEKSFGIALLFLLLVPLVNALQQPQLAGLYAVYAYYFLAVATGSAIIESRRRL